MNQICKFGDWKRCHFYLDLVLWMEERLGDLSNPTPSSLDGLIEHTMLLPLRNAHKERHSHTPETHLIQFSIISDSDLFFECDKSQS